MKTLLIIDTEDNNWYDIFSDYTDLEGEELKIEQSRWSKVTLTSYSNTGTVVDIFPSDKPILNTPQNTKRICQPDFILVRNLVRSWHPHQDYRNLLFGLMYAGVPAMNSLESIYMCLDRPVVHGGLLAIQRQLGLENFPLIEQTYYPNYEQMLITPRYPLVIKVGHGHAGMGKIRLQQHSEFEDLRTLIALHEDYLTAEPFYDSDYDIRIKKIGSHYRAYKRQAFNWKRNMDNAIMEEIPLTSEYKRWVDAASQLFGGLDWLALDAIHTSDGKEYILEVNDTAMGLHPDHKKGDMGQMRDLILEKMRTHHESSQETRGIKR